jgi:hypothetical protein
VPYVKNPKTFMDAMEDANYELREFVTTNLIGSVPATNCIYVDNYESADVVTACLTIMEKRY